MSSNSGKSQDDHISNLRYSQQVYLSIESVHFHPQYNVGAYLNNDLAVIRLKGTVRLTSRVRAACLPSPTTSYSPGRECTISGWGSTGQASGGYSRRLQAASVPILETRRCMESQVYGPDKLTSGMFCAGFLAGGGGQLPGGQRGSHGLLQPGHQHSPGDHLLGIRLWQSKQAGGLHQGGQLLGLDQTDNKLCVAIHFFL